VSFSLHPGAEKDIADALDFYLESAGLVVAERFLAEFERVANFLAENPEAGTVSARNRRSFPLHVFPYSVVYMPANGEIRVLIVRHQHRKPGQGARRR
jgi:toxin ParE1/3/4